jgi:hypothetical protein
MNAAAAVSAVVTPGMDGDRSPHGRAGGEARLEDECEHRDAASANPGREYGLAGDHERRDHADAREPERDHDREGDGERTRLAHAGERGRDHEHADRDDTVGTEAFSQARK